mgnify:CR=1 FL=1
MSLLSWLRIIRIVGRFKEAMRVKRFYGLGIAILLAFVQVADAVAQVVPVEWAGVVRAASALIAALLVAVGYNSNPDGTHVRLPYEPKRK